MRVGNVSLLNELLTNLKSRLKHLDTDQYQDNKCSTKVSPFATQRMKCKYLSPELISAT